MYVWIGYVLMDLNLDFREKSFEFCRELFKYDFTKQGKDESLSYGLNGRPFTGGDTMD